MSNTPHVCYEESRISDLPSSWLGENTKKELLAFLQDNWNQRDALFDDGNKSTNQQFITFDRLGRLRANNYIGTIAFKGEVLNIYPKVFYIGGSNMPQVEDLTRNLVQWLDYCHKFDPRYISIQSDLSGDTTLKELFITLFVKRVESVFERGLYFTYEDQEEDLSTIRGKFDVSDFVTRKIPSGQMNKFHCEYSSFEFDNLLNRIIKQVLSLILKDGTRENNERKIRKLLNKLTDVSEEKYTARDCNKVRLNRMQRGYSDILSMCKMFLLNQEPTYSINSDDTFCFLFPCELLFEGFIGGFLKEVVENEGGKATLQDRKDNLVKNIRYNNKDYGGGFELRPDILCTINDKTFLLDTKYKQIDRFETAKENEALWKEGLIKGVTQSDLYQISIYALKNKLKDAYLIYPLNRKEELESDYPVLEELVLTGNELEDLNFIKVHLLRLPFVFEEDVEVTKTNLKNELLKVFR